MTRGTKPRPMQGDWRALLEAWERGLKVVHTDDLNPLVCFECLKRVSMTFQWFRPPLETDPKEFSVVGYHVCSDCWDARDVERALKK